MLSWSAPAWPACRRPCILAGAGRRVTVLEAEPTPGEGGPGVPARTGRRDVPPRHRPVRVDDARPVRRLLRGPGRVVCGLGDPATARTCLPGPVRRRHRPFGHQRRRGDDAASSCLLRVARRRRPTATGGMSSSSPACTACRCASSSTATSTPRSTWSARRWPGSLRCAASHDWLPRSPGISATMNGAARIFSFQAMYAGLSPARALAIYAVSLLHGPGRGRVLPDRRDERPAHGHGEGSAQGRRRVQAPRSPMRPGAGSGRRAAHSPRRARLITRRRGDDPRPTRRPEGMLPARRQALHDRSPRPDPLLTILCRPWRGGEPAQWLPDAAHHTMQLRPRLVPGLRGPRHGTSDARPRPSVSPLPSVRGPTLSPTGNSSAYRALSG